MEFVVDLLFSIFTAIIGLLPFSPFRAMLDYVGEIPVLGVVNWFIPFDTCLICLEIWAVAMLGYYIVQNMDKILDTWSKIRSMF